MRKWKSVGFGLTVALQIWLSLPLGAVSAEQPSSDHAAWPMYHDDAQVVKEIESEPVSAGPSLSHGKMHVGGNTRFTPYEFECLFPKSHTGTLRCFGLPDGQEADKPAQKDHKPALKIPDGVSFRTPANCTCANTTSTLRSLHSS
jgi:hypothetical protein